MEIRKSVISKIFAAAYMQRWNDKLRPMELYELDKQAHKMIIAYFLGKFEEGEKGFDWIQIIEGGIFELLQRIVLTDIKPPVFYKIKKEHPAEYQKLNDWVYRQLYPVISTLGEPFCKRFRDYFSDSENINHRVLRVAHYKASEWEFNILKNANPTGYEMREIEKRLKYGLEQSGNLKGLEVLSGDNKTQSFINLCGELRFQARWSHLHRVPKTSVMGHMLFVAVLAYLFSLQINFCREGRVNNYFTALFHDLPEVLTRDIISPVKGSIPALRALIKEIEADFMQRDVYGLLPADWRQQIEFFTEDEFEDKAFIKGQMAVVSSSTLLSKYNRDRYKPRCGKIVEAADKLSAFVEVCEALRNGCGHDEFVKVKIEYKDKYKALKIGTLNLGHLYADYD